VIRCRCLVVSFLLSFLLVDIGMGQAQAVAVSAAPDGSARISLTNGEKIEDKKPTPAKSGSRQVANSFSPLAFHADAPLYIPGAKARIPAELVTCEHICDWT
jgi:hypothetical protein